MSRIESNLKARNYVKVDKESDPDLAINVYIVQDFDIFQQVVNPGYYSGYYGYNPYYYYAPYIQTYTSNTASLIIQVVDLVNRDASNKVKVIWVAYMGDLVSTVDRGAQLNKGIDQAFLQSPYLTTQ